MSESKAAPNKSLLERLDNHIKIQEWTGNAETIAGKLLREARDTIAAQQAEIDRLMWEHCPDEMEAAQIARYEDAQEQAGDE